MNENPHRSHVNFLGQLEAQGVFPFFGVLPLQKEGKFLLTYPHLGTEVNHEGKLVFVPHGNILLVPMQVYWGDQIRTSLAGNPSLFLWIFIVPEGFDPTIVWPLIVNSLALQDLVLTNFSNKLETLGGFLGF